MGMRALRGIAIAGVALFAAAGPAAAVVTYSFEATSAFEGGQYGRFVLSLAGPVTSNTIIPAGQLTSCEVLSPADRTCGDHRFTFTTVQEFGILANMIEFASNEDDNEVGRSFFYFAPGAFGANGTYQTIIFGTNQAATLTVSGIGGGGGAIPEPASWAMLIAGFGLTGAAMRRRRQHVAA